MRNLFALSADYRDDDSAAQLFFAEVQSKPFYAVTRQTAAELIVSRVDFALPKMALTNWSGARARKHDVIVAKNDLNVDEVDTLNRPTIVFLETAELRAMERKQLTLDYWRQNVDRPLEFNERPVLKNAGNVRSEQMKTIVQERYETFDTNRRSAEAIAADAEDIKTLGAIEQQAKREKKVK